MKLFPALAWVFFCQPVAGQIEFHNLGEILDYADQHSIVAHQSDLQRAIAKKDEQINKSNLLPKLNSFATADYFPIITTQLIPESIFGGASDKFRKVQFGLPWSFSSGLELTVPLINFERWDQLKRIRLQSLQTNWNTQAAIEAMHIQLTQWYYQSLLADQLVQLNRSNQQVTGQLLQIMDQRKRNGVVNPADYNRSRNLQLDMQAAGIEYEKNQQQSIIVLKQLLNLPDSVSLILSDSIAATTIPGIETPDSISSRPAWKEAAARLLVAQQQQKEIKNAALPKIGFTGKYTYQWQMKPSAGQHVNFDFSSIGLRLDFPLFQGSFYKASRQKAAMQVSLAKWQQQQTINDLVRQQNEWNNNFSAAIKKQTLLRQKAELAADNLRIAKLNMQEGVMEFEEFNNIFQEYNKARLDLLQNTSDGIVYRLLLTIK